MCRTEVPPSAEVALAGLLVDLRDALAARLGADPADVLVGPVDLGGEDCPWPV